MDDHTNFYAGLNFASRNLLDWAAEGTFMEITLGDATKLLDNIMANYSQWHTERSSSKKVHAIEEIRVNYPFALNGVFVLSFALRCKLCSVLPLVHAQLL